MNLKFEEFKKLNPSLKELDSIRTKSFKKFEIQGFPTKKQEQWKYSDLKSIINNNFENLEIFSDKNFTKYNNKLLIKDFEHNKIILLNGNFIESNFDYENKEKINIKSLKKAISFEADFEKIKNYFKEDQNSMISLNHALTSDGILLEINNN